jgi:hypothetical protein
MTAIAPRRWMPVVTAAVAAVSVGTLGGLATELSPWNYALANAALEATGLALRACMDVDLRLVGDGGGISMVEFPQPCQSTPPTVPLHGQLTPRDRLERPVFQSAPPGLGRIRGAFPVALDRGLDHVSLPHFPRRRVASRPLSRLGFVRRRAESGCRSAQLPAGIGGNTALLLVKVHS